MQIVCSAHTLIFKAIQFFDLSKANKNDKKVENKHPLRVRGPPNIEKKLYCKLEYVM
jgi:hypothetical protein